MGEQFTFTFTPSIVVIAQSHPNRCAFCSFLASKNSPTNSTLNHVSNATNVGETTPPTNPRANKKRLRRGGPFNSFFRRLKRKQIASGNSSCGGLEECSRICVGQNERLTNSSDCMTFKFRCTTRRMFRTPRKPKGKGRKKNKD